MKTKRFIKIILISGLMLAPLLMGGCQKKCPKPADNIAGTSEFRADCPTADDVTDSNTKKNWIFYFVYDNVDAFREQIQAFQSQFPNIRVRTKKFVDLKEYEDLVVNEIAEGEGPDVFMIHNSWITKHQKKLLPMPLDAPIVTPPDVFRQTFFQAAANDLIIDESIYGMPLAMDNLALYYNKQYFADLIATTDEPAKLWEEIAEQVFQLTSRNNSPERFALSGIAMGRGDNLNTAVDLLYTLFLQYGVGFYDEKEESATFANRAQNPADTLAEPAVEALKWFTSFALPSYKYYSWNKNLTGYAPDQAEVNPFVRGKVAMIAGYPYLYQNLVQAIQNEQKTGGDHIDIEDIGIAPMPQLVTPTESTRRDTLASYFPLVVARTTNMPKEAWTFVQYLTTADALQTYHKKTNRPTPRKDMVTEQQTEPLFGVFAYQAPFAKSLKIYDAEKYDLIFREAIQSVVESRASLKQALQTAQTQVTCVIRKQKKLIETDEDCGI
ncbi:extracellular solute-binding protein [Candidatus Peregrinibacteria bacterium]|nr:MAG: extracellular solute-binding protein [Candidatus Peregrinibacteria bacterium]